MATVGFKGLTRSLAGQIFLGCHPRVGLSVAEVPAGCLLWRRCTGLSYMNNEYTRK